MASGALNPRERSLRRKEPRAHRRIRKSMRAIARAMPELELALLRRSVHELGEASECCGRCQRRPLVGERMYEYESGKVLCELCRDAQRAAPASSHLVHGPEFGHTLRLIDQRP
jgi:hypothetical protein